MIKGKLVLDDYAILSDGTGWRLPDKELAWKLIWSEITDEDKLRLASMIESYHALLMETTTTRRNFICKEIRKLYE